MHLAAKSMVPSWWVHELWFGIFTFFLHTSVGIWHLLQSCNFQMTFEDLSGHYLWVTWVFDLELYNSGVVIHEYFFEFIHRCLDPE